MMSVNQLIPQRPPFQMIDKMIQLESGVSAQASKLITINEWYFNRASATAKYVPSPILIEIMAQTGAAAILAASDLGQNVFLGGVQEAHFYQPVQPGDALLATVKLTKVRRQIGSGYGELRCHGKLVATAELRFAIQA
ncbi:3-hydroxyacyl-ACP dehydratase FabZ family protein [Lactiplantibacillus plajomi]|uniref:3-hydroxyacyl-ACP dehydratase FabZ family protein n=1 Tax=Lactiplantibacillus plajomi TaxID=1457217 RepID=A0ABV6K8T8_9LACO|nr:3-hydroxyacyl-ACP dehydratase FabZ family protein [Lactiplantibacillus plajomi]